MGLKLDGCRVDAMCFRQSRSKMQKKVSGLLGGVLQFFWCILADWLEDKTVFLSPCHAAALDPMLRMSGAVSRPLPILPIRL
jgi:hypothetical protein